MDDSTLERLRDLSEKNYSTLDEATALELLDIAITFYKNYSKRICNYFELIKELYIDSNGKDEKDFFDYQARLAIMTLKKELEKYYQKIRQGGQNNG